MPTVEGHELILRRESAEPELYRATCSCGEEQVSPAPPAEVRGLAWHHLHLRLLREWGVWK